MNRRDDRNPWRCVLPWAALLAAGLTFHRRQLFFGECTFVRDVHRIFVPAKKFLADQLALGVLPQWWPFDGAGSPFLAQPLFSAFHPSTLLYAVLPFWGAFAAQDFFATALMLAGTYLCARKLLRDEWAAFLSALLFTFNGYVAGLSEFTFSKLSAAALPWYAWSLLRFRRRGLRWVAIPSLAMGLLLLGGDPQIALLSAAAGALLLLSVEASPKAAGVAIGAPLLGAMVAAVQLLPAAMVADQTARGGVLTEANTWSFGVRHLLGLVLPLDHGALDFVRSTYLGLPAIALAGVSLALLKKERAVRPLWLVALVGLWLAAGDGLLLNRIARFLVPYWSDFRYPIKSVLLFYFALALLSGAGFSLLAKSARGRSRYLLLALALVPVIAHPLSPEGVLAAAALVALAVVTQSRAMRFTSVAAMGIGVLSIAAAQPPTVDRGFYAFSPLARELVARGVSVAGPMFDRIDEGERPLAEWPLATAAGAGGAGASLNALFGLPSLSPAMPGASLRVRQLFSSHQKELASRLAGVFGVRYLVLREPVAPHLAQMVRARDTRYGYSLVELRRHLPRAYVVEKALPAEGTQEALALLTSEQFKPGREVILESRAGLSSGPDAPLSPALAVDVVVEANGEERLNVSLGSPGFLVLNEAWFEGWTATVDGAPTEVLRANYAMMAVAVPAGAHSIEFRFRTPGLAVGAVLSASFALLLVLALFLDRKNGAKSSP